MTQSWVVTNGFQTGPLVPDRSPGRTRAAPRGPRRATSPPSSPMSARRLVWLLPGEVNVDVRRPDHPTGSPLPNTFLPDAARRPNHNLAPTKPRRLDSPRPASPTRPGTAGLGLDHRPRANRTRSLAPFGDALASTFGQEVGAGAHWQPLSHEAGMRTNLSVEAEPSFGGAAGPRPHVPQRPSRRPSFAKPPARLHLGLVADGASSTGVGPTRSKGSVLCATEDERATETMARAAQVRPWRPLGQRVVLPPPCLASPPVSPVPRRLRSAIRGGFHRGAG